MDMTTMAVASNAIAMANQTAQFSEGLDAGTIDFSSLLASMTGGDATATDASGVLGLSAQELQTSLMLNAMGVLAQAQSPVVTDPELAALLSRMGSLKGMESAELEQLFEQLRDRLKQLAEESGTLAAGQQAVAMLAGMLYQMTGTQPDSSTLSTLNGSSDAVLTTLTNGTTADILSLITTTQAQAGTSAAAQQLSAMNDLSSMLGEGSDNTALLAVATAQADANANVEAKNEVTGQSGQNTASGGGQAATGNSFEAAVRTAKQQLSDHVTLSGKAADPEDEALDIDALQARVDSGTYLRNTALSTQPQAQTGLTTPTPQAQLAETVGMALQTGEQQLTVRLNPEELGEVTLRLTKTAEGIRLSIVAQNPETHALLAAQADTLRTALKPLNVEVDAILSQQQYELLSQNEGRQNRHNDGRAMHGAAYYGDEPLTAAETDGQAPKTAPYAALDTYI